MHLLIAHHLQGVLGLAQHEVRLGQLRHFLGRHQLRPYQQR
jgi:hypothetical protein